MPGTSSTQSRSRNIVKLGPDNGVVGRAFRFPGLEIHVGNSAAVGEWRSRKDVIDAPAKIALKRFPKEIPVGILHTIGVELTKDVDESPTNCILVGGSRIDVEIYIVHTPLGVIDVDRFWSDI